MDGTSNRNLDPYDGFGGQWGYRKDSQAPSGPDLYLCGQRYYSVDNCRWLTRDPIGFGGGVNLYEFAAIRGGAVGWNKLERTGKARIEGKPAG